jgi:hypothetical protein
MGISPVASDDEDAMVANVVTETDFGAPTTRAVASVISNLREMPSALPQLQKIAVAGAPAPIAEVTEKIPAKALKTMAELQDDLAAIVERDNGDETPRPGPPSVRGVPDKDVFARTSAVPRPTTASSAGGDSLLSALHMAARVGNKERLMRLLASKEVSFVNLIRITELPQFDIDVLDSFGRTPLMHAVHYGQIECAHILLAQGANPDVQETSSGATALHEAVYHGAPLMACVFCVT